MSDMVLIETEPLAYAALHQVVPVAEIGQAMGAGIAEVVAAIKSQGLTPGAPWFTHHYHKPLETFDFEICFPVEGEFVATGRVYPAVWPAMRVARTVHRGSYGGLVPAWMALERWIREQELTPGTEFWERYTVTSSTVQDEAELQTELNWPVS